MHRLLVATETLSEAKAVLPPAAARHAKVLRLKPGEEVELFDGRGRVRRYVSSSDGLSAAGDVTYLPPPSVRITLFACVTKGSRWDWTVEKAVELGVSRIVPVISERCIVRLAPSERPAKAERWRRIAEDAARQSDAVHLPEVMSAVDFPDALALVRECRTFVGALTKPPPPPLWTLLASERTSTRPCAGGWGLFVGPEGDFTPDELSVLLSVAVPASFGPTILRAETAAIFGLSVLAAALQDSDGAASPR